MVAQTGWWTVLDIAAPGANPESAGVLLADPGDGRLYVRFRRDLEDLYPDGADVLEALVEDLEAKARELGAVAVLNWLEDTASNFVRVADREEIEVTSFSIALNWLYHRHIRPKVLPFRTHLPRYTLQAAAGKWGPERDVAQEPEGWVEAPEGLRLTEELFVAQVVGQSMEPLIRDGSLCVFRAGVAGTRQGRRVLVANYGEAGEQRFTVKRYESTARPGESGRRIILHPLNPEFEAWEIDPEAGDRVAVIAEFVQVLSD